MSLVGEVQVAEHPTAYPNRHTEEAGHLRMALGEPDRLRVAVQVIHPQRLRLDDELTEQSPPGGQWSDGRGEFVVDAYVDEVAQIPVFPDHPEGAVAGIHQGDSRRNHAPQCVLQMQPIGHRDERIQQRFKALIGDDHVSPIPP